jgi:hypothetical protein
LRHATQLAESPDLVSDSRDYVFVYVTDSEIRTCREGEEEIVGGYADGFTQYTEVGEHLPPHSISNVGRRPHRQIIIELKGPSASPTSRKSRGQRHEDRRPPGRQPLGTGRCRRDLITRDCCTNCCTMALPCGFPE